MARREVIPGQSYPLYHADSKFYHDISTNEPSIRVETPYTIGGAPTELVFWTAFERITQSRFTEQLRNIAYPLGVPSLLIEPVEGDRPVVRTTPTALQLRSQPSTPDQYQFLRNNFFELAGNNNKIYYMEFADPQEREIPEEEVAQDFKGSSIPLILENGRMMNLLGLPIEALLPDNPMVLARGRFRVVSNPELREYLDGFKDPEVRRFLGTHS
jgi:hypothetical protein